MSIRHTQSKAKMHAQERLQDVKRLRMHHVGVETLTRDVGAMKDSRWRGGGVLSEGAMKAQERSLRRWKGESGRSP